MAGDADSIPSVDQGGFFRTSEVAGKIVKKKKNLFALYEKLKLVFLVNS